MLARLEDSIFEGLDPVDAKLWPLRFMGAIEPGRDLARVGWAFAHWRLTDNIVTPGIDHPLVRGAVKKVVDLLAKLKDGDTVTERAAWSAADAAAMAEAAEDGRHARHLRAAIPLVKNPTRHLPGPWWPLRVVRQPGETGNTLEKCAVQRSANQIGCHIRAVRKARGYTLQVLADRAGASKSYIWELERGSGSRPSAQMLSRVAAALGVTLESILGDEGFAASADKVFFKKYQALDATSKNIFRRLADLLADQKQEN